MFSLNFDPIFLGLERAKALAKRLAEGRAHPAAPADPRQFQRMQDELRLAREQVRLQVTRGRLLW